VGTAGRAKAKTQAEPGGADGRIRDGRCWKHREALARRAARPRPELGGPAGSWVGQGGDRPCTQPDVLVDLSTTLIDHAFAPDGSTRWMHRVRVID